jgi:DNA-binding HxlR family transcriptional regulator
MSQPNVFDPNCGSRRVLALIADRWTAIVVYALAGGTHRFGELQRVIGGVSQKVLTDTLRRLEQDGLVTRTVYPVVPPKVEYALTPLGQTLTEPLAAICRWSEDHLAEVDAARAQPRAVAPAAAVPPMPNEGPPAPSSADGR